MANNALSWEQKNKPIPKSDKKSVKVQARVKEIWNKELKDKIVVAEGENVKKTEILEKTKEVLKKHTSDLEISDIKLFDDEKDKYITRDIENKLNQIIKIKINDRIGFVLDIGYTIQEAIYIDSVAPTTNAGAFDAYDKDKVIEAFILKNPQLRGLTKDNFEVVGQATNNSVTVKVKNSDKFQGQITINFTIRTQINTQNNKKIIIASSAGVGGVGILGSIVTLFRRRKKK
ncbi:hypothetical protein [Mycoplasma mycoides]|uniref:hypothetical protein n=1 Tax=Mycoplasma mycoides TaxID=2102 RepID=UPI000771AB8D|nr:hypothetical protein [Mycoplasma mycoides]AMK56542.1 hypothetical protein MSCT144_06460 [Mycoplasma mycoides subsp. mycoides]QKK61199.1 hypothetical protein HR079_02925 [Mycoplasma mycoides]